MSTGRNSRGDLREDIREAIERVWPAGVVDGFSDSEESYFTDVYPKIAAALGRLKGAQLVHEREPEGQPVWYERYHDEDDPPDDQENSRSYHLFFVCPEGGEFTYKTEMESLGDPGYEDDEEENEWPTGPVAGTGRTGWSVAVSLIAPLAAITLGEMESFEDGTSLEPAIEPNAFSSTGERIDLEADFRKAKGEQAFAKLLKLRGRICGILGKYGIGVLPEEEWRKPVPRLRADRDILLEEPLRVLDAFFFEWL